MAGRAGRRRVHGVPGWVRSLGRIVAVTLPWVVGSFYILVAVDYREGDPPVALVAAIVLAVVQGAALTWRRERPELVTAVVLAAGVPYHLLVPDLIIPFAGLVALWSLAMARAPRVSLVGLAGVLALSAVDFFIADVSTTPCSRSSSRWACGRSPKPPATGAPRSRRRPGEPWATSRRASPASCTT